MLKKNMGSFDRTLRVAVAAGILLLIFLDVVSGTLAIVLGVLAVVFVLTSLIGSCPLYLPFGLSTRGRQKQSPA